MITNDRFEGARADAEEVAKRLGIELHVLDLHNDFEHILDYLCDEYRRGRTPNPCVFCNRHIKFGKLWEFAREKDADLLATGHYARIVKDNGSVGLYRAVDADKDQSYVLSMVNKEILGDIVLPMGNRSKKEVRELAAEFGLGTEHRAESQEICFIPDNDYAAAIEQRCPELVRHGKIVDSSGRILGEHNGVHRFTIGQRRGLGVAMGKPYYVVRIDAESNTVTLGPREEVMHRKLLAVGVNWLIDEPRSAFRATVKIRYNDSGGAGLVVPQGETVNWPFSTWRKRTATEWRAGHGSRGHTTEKGIIRIQSQHRRLNDGNRRRHSETAYEQGCGGGVEGAARTDCATGRNRGLHIDAAAGRIYERQSRIERG
jgi:tRNA-specific 2-thiouridylase